MAVTYTRIGTVTRNPNGQAAHALSTWSQISAALAAGYQGFQVFAFQTGSNGGRIALSMSIGTAGNEPASSFVDDLLFLSGSNYQTSHIIPIPQNSGVRLSIAFRCHNANSASIVFVVYGITATAGELLSGITAIRPFNYDTAATNATTVLPGDSVSTANKGAYVEMTSSLSAAIAGFGIAPVVNNVTYSGTYLINIATGAGGSEVVVVPDIPARRVTGNDPYFTTTFYPFAVAAGTRVAACQQADTVTVTVRDIGVIVYAYYGTITGGSSSLVATEDDVQYEIRPLSGASQILSVSLVDTSGNPKTGLIFSDVTCYMSVDGAAPTQQTLVTATVGAYTSLGFKEISAANMAGSYMFCPATLPSSGKRAVFKFTASGTRPAYLAVDLVASDPRIAALSATDISDAVNRDALTYFKSMKRTGTGGNAGMSWTGPDGADSGILATDITAKPVTEVDTAS